MKPRTKNQYEQDRWEQALADKANESGVDLTSLTTRVSALESWRTTAAGLIVDLQNENKNLWIMLAFMSGKSQAVSQDELLKILSLMR
jgi:hypothetical protein